MPGQGRKHLQLAGIGFADAWPGLEASATCWNWICRCLVSDRKHPATWLELDLQMPGRGWKHLQFAGIGFADAVVGAELNIAERRKHLQFAGLNLQIHILGLEASATCWNWICRCLVRVGSICNLLELDLQMPGRGLEASAILLEYGVADAWLGLEDICNLLELDLQMPGQGLRMHLQLC